LRSYALPRTGGGLLATRVALVHTGRVPLPLLAVDTGALYTLVEPPCYVNLQEKKKTLPLSGASHRLLYCSLCTEPGMRMPPHDRKLLG